MAKVLLTGNAGYLGQSLSQLLLSEGHEPVGLPGRLETLDPASLDVDAVIHCAVSRQNDFPPEQMNLTNVTGTQSLMAALVRPTRIVFVSSRWVYGPLDPQPCTEDYPPHPNTSYGHSKWQAEQLLANSHHPVFIIRSSALFGAGVERLGRTFLDKALLSLVKREPITLFTPDSLRDYVYVWDLANGILQALNCPELWPACVNLAGPRRSVHGLVKLLHAVYRQHTGYDGKLILRPGHGPAAEFPALDTSKWLNLFGNSTFSPDQLVVERMCDFIHNAS